MTKIQQVTQSKFTSVAGVLSSTSAILLALVPGDVLSTCSAAISETQNPAVIGTLLGAGVLLSSIGPSLVGRSEK